MMTIPLSQGFVAQVDDEDYERCDAHKWSATKTKNTVYAVRKIKTPDGKTTSQLLHRFILDVTCPEIDIDHWNGDGLDCRRSNLRTCVRGENDGNRRKTNGTSRFKGVSWDSTRGLWRASITIRGRSKFLGRYANESDAALAYDSAARESFGVFARCNFPASTACIDR
jgi:hypothetical protein